jgi:ABC-type transport system involved in multi-copper enzyme maturation permease subunit
MLSILKNLAWKEFHELISAALAATAVTLSIPMCYVFRDVNAAYFGVHTAFVGYPLLAGVFFGMRAAAGERTSRTASFIAALPISYRFLGTARLAMSLLAAALPVIALLVLGAILKPRIDDFAESRSIPLVMSFGWSILATTLCVTVAAVAGLGQPTEVRAGAIGLAGIFIVAIGGWLFFMLAAERLQSLGFRTPEGLEWLALLALPAAGLLLLLVAFPLNYYRALGHSAERTGRPWTIAAWRPTPVPAPIAALVWKAFREIGFLGLQVFVIALATSLILGAAGVTGSAQTNWQLITGALPVVLWAGGFALAILIGVGAVIGDLQAGVNTFWRSRPIPPQSWYWTKFLIGLATILVAIELPFFLTPSSLILTEGKGLLWWPLVWNVTFSFALTATCLVRQPAHAGILAVGAVAILYAVIEAPFGGFTPGEPGAPMSVLAPVFLAAFIVSTILGCWAAEHDVALS